MAKPTANNNKFTIWVDADAFPSAARDILFRASGRTDTPVVLVANRRIKPPSSPYISSVLVPAGDDVADHYIIENMADGDLVITGDIPLAAEVLSNRGQSLSPRGELFTEENITDRLGSRNFMDSLRASGIETGGPRPLGKADLQNFANGLDRILTRQHKRR